MADFIIANHFDERITGGAIFVDSSEDHHMADAWLPTPSFSPSEMLLLSLAESGLRRRCSVRPCDCSADARELLKVRADRSAWADAADRL